MKHPNPSSPVDLSMKPRRESLLVTAYKAYPSTFLARGIGISLTTSLYIYNYLLDRGIHSIWLRVLLTATIVTAVPTISLYLITLARAPRIRKRQERDAAYRAHVAHGELQR